MTSSTSSLDFEQFPCYILHILQASKILRNDIAIKCIEAQAHISQRLESHREGLVSNDRAWFRNHSPQATGSLWRSTVKSASVLSYHGQCVAIRSSCFLCTTVGELLQELQGCSRQRSTIASLSMKSMNCTKWGRYVSKKLMHCKSIKFSWIIRSPNFAHHKKRWRSKILRICTSGYSELSRNWHLIQKATI